MKNFVKMKMMRDTKIIVKSEIMIIIPVNLEALHTIFVTLELKQLMIFLLYLTMVLDMTIILLLKKL